MPGTSYAEVTTGKLLNVSFTQRAPHVIAVRVNRMDLSIVAQEGDAPALQLLRIRLTRCFHLEIYCRLPNVCECRPTCADAWQAMAMTSNGLPYFLVYQQFGLCLSLLSSAEAAHRADKLLP